jgi:hypothetical protein
MDMRFANMRKNAKIKGELCWSRQRVVNYPPAKTYQAAGALR